MINILVDHPHAQLEVLEVILEDRRQTIHDVCNHIGLWYGSCQHILADELNMRRIEAKFVPRLLKNEQWDHRVQVCTELQKAVRHDPNFLSRVITGDVRPPYNFCVLPKMKLRLKGRRFASIEEVQAESQQILNTLTPADFSASKSGKIARIVVYKPKVTTSKVTVEIKT